MSNLKTPNHTNLLFNLAQLREELNRDDVYTIYDSPENTQGWCFTVVYLGEIKQKVKIYNKVVFCNDYINLSVEERGLDDRKFIEPEHRETSPDDYTTSRYKQFVELWRDSQKYNEYRNTSRYWHYTDKHTFSVFRDNRYKFLPGLVFETDNFLGFEYFDSDDEWSIASEDDLIMQLPGTSLNTLTPLGRDVIRDLHAMQSENVIDLPKEDVGWWEREILHEPNRAASSGKCDVNALSNQVPGVTYGSLSPTDLVIKKSDRKVLDWKFIDLEDLMFSHSPNMSMILTLPCLDDNGKAQYCFTGSATLRVFYRGEWLDLPLPT